MSIAMLTNIALCVKVPIVHSEFSKVPFYVPLPMPFQNVSNKVYCSYVKVQL